MNKPTRFEFITWVKRTSWHPDGLDYVLRTYGDSSDEFASANVEGMYQAYCAGYRKGSKAQKDKYDDQLNRSKS